jgi:hypothetical protein
MTRFFTKLAKRVDTLTRQVDMATWIAKPTWRRRFGAQGRSLDQVSGVGGRVPL